MRIVSSTLDLRASQVGSRLTTRQEALKTWVGDEPADRPTRAAAARPGAGEPGALARPLSALAAQLRAAAPARPSVPAQLPSTSPTSTQGGTAGDPLAAPADPGDQLDLAILLRTFRLAGGLTAAAREIQQAYAGPAPAEASAGPAEMAFGPARAQPSSAAAPAAAPPARQGWGLRYDLVETTAVHESSAFTASARVTTADGRTIQVEAALAMARTEVSTREVHLRAGDAALVDPLVLNLAGGPAALAGRTTFDLDADGRDETMAGLAGGSAWLALDRNGDGAIGSGAELFGPTTGSGFGELAALDVDGNGWVDEGDPAFAALRLWRPDGPLTTLSAAGVGAIATRAVATPFSLTSGGAVQGRIAETGLFLREDGTAGTVQHVDLVA